jgi:hypothetical protein
MFSAAAMVERNGAPSSKQRATAWRPRWLTSAYDLVDLDARRRHPLLKVIHDAASDMVRYAGELGLTPVARTRIAQGIHQQPPPNRFSGLLAGPQE